MEKETYQSNCQWGSCLTTMILHPNPDNMRAFPPPLQTPSTYQGPPPATGGIAVRLTALLRQVAVPLTLTLLDCHPAVVMSENLAALPLALLLLLLRGQSVWLRVTPPAAQGSEQPGCAAGQRASVRREEHIKEYICKSTKDRHIKG
jgi:hypothetical protein